MELNEQKLEGILRNTEEHNFTDEITKKSTFIFVNSVKDKDNEVT